MNAHEPAIVHGSEITFKKLQKKKWSKVLLIAIGSSQKVWEKNMTMVAFLKIYSFPHLHILANGVHHASVGAFLQYDAFLE